MLLMSFRTTLVWFLHVLAAFCSGLELEDDGKWCDSCCVYRLQMQARILGCLLRFGQMWAFPFLNVSVPAKNRTILIFVYSE